MSPPIPVGIVPHTHWDREWYAPFQTFRLQLVELLDGLLPLLEADLSYPRFLLDGQTAVVDDYLEVRPEAEARIRRLVASGRLQLGPWMVLMDEFMVSGETMVRDLQLGLRRAAALGGAMPVGYLPDMFGHVAQMPQLLRQAGLDHAVLWRGVPAAIASTGFWWEAPDGSRVRAEYLYGSYSNGRDLPDDAKQLVARVRGYDHELGGVRPPGGGLLVMNGTDHQLPQPGLGRVVAEANAIQSDYRLEITSLPEYLAAQPLDGLPTWRGELRSGARANVLMGVASNRVDVHRACAAAERSIERRAEPLSALALPPAEYPTALLGIAWQRLVHNSAHDSSCACSHDEVVDQVLVRYREARQIGDGLVRSALHRLAADVDAPPGATLVVNPTASTRTGLVECFVPAGGPVHLAAPDGTALATQVVREIGGEGFSTVVTGRKIGWVLDLMRGSQFAGARVGGYDIERAADGAVAVTVRGAHPQEATADVDELREELLRLADDDVTFRFRTMLAPVRLVAFATDPVPGFGWRTYTVSDGAGPPTAVRVGERTIANEHLAVTVAGDATFSVETEDGLVLSGLGRLVDGGDGGDTYNYDPPTDDRVIDAPERVDVRVVERGPVRARIEIHASYVWPTNAIGDARRCSRRSDEVATADVVTTLELRTGEQFLRVRHVVDNHCRDHRLRAHFPLPARVAGTDAECAFAVVRRGLTAEGGPGEVGLPTFVSRRFVDASDSRVGLALVHDGLLEYEVVEDGRELALTLLRAVGYLSRAALSLRPDPAGPTEPVDGAQMQGRQTVEYAVLPHSGDWRAASLYAAADAFLVPFERVRAGGVARASLAASGTRLAVRGAEVSAVLRDPGGLVVRVFNPTGERVTVEVDLDGGPAAGWVVDLRGSALERFEGSLELAPARIATLRLS